MFQKQDQSGLLLPQRLILQYCLSFTRLCKLFFLQADECSPNNLISDFFEKLGSKSKCSTEMMYPFHKYYKADRLIQIR